MLRRALMLAGALCAIGGLRLKAGEAATPSISNNIADRDEAGRELAQKVLAMVPQENSRTSGFLRIRDRDGRTTEVPVTCEVRINGKTWQVSYEARTSGSSTPEKLTIIHADGQTNQYLYTKSGAAESQKLSGNRACIPFAGSDFWLADLGLEFLHWPNQRLLKTEMRKGRSCNVLQSVNPTPTPGGYARVVSWLDRESGGPVLAEGYDVNGKLLKEFSIRSVHKVSGQWQLEEMEIRSVIEKSRTRIEFGTEQK